jgi:hydrogenase maturation factor
MTKWISLSVNNALIEMDYFVQRFVDHTVGGIVSSLQGVADVSDIEVKIEGSDVSIFVNGGDVPLNDFVAAIVSNTVRGMVSSLKGVESTEKIRIGIQR